MLCRGTSVHLTPGQMLQKLSPLNSAFDKSHYSLLGPRIGAISTFPRHVPLSPLPASSPPSFFLLRFGFILSVLHAHQFREKKSLSDREDTVVHAETNRIKTRSKFTNWRFNARGKRTRRIFSSLFPWSASRDRKPFKAKSFAKFVYARL